LGAGYCRRRVVGRDVFYQAPLYPYFLAILYRVLDDSTTTVRLVQAVVGAASCGLLAWAGISLFGRRGLIAGVALAFYPPAIFLDGLIDKSSLTTCLTAALIAILAFGGTRLSLRLCGVAGILMGLLALARENALLLVIPVLLWVVFGSFSGRWQTRIVPASVFLGACALVLVPVGLRNLAVGGEFHLTTSQFGPNIYIGNHSGALGTYEGLIQGHGSVSDEREDATWLAEQAAGRKLTPGEVSNYWTQKSIDYIRRQPLNWLALLGRKLALTNSEKSLVINCSLRSATASLLAAGSAACCILKSIWEVK
jgi:4-amino-4-deoxy-L-arabinose transferase-like glycosyltransferase